MKKVKVLYILGSGRSGSTIFDLLLGNNPGIESFGEIANLARSGWLNNEYCSSGDRVNESPFWNKVKERYLYYFKNNPNKIQNLADINRQINTKKAILKHYFLNEIQCNTIEYLELNEAIFKSLSEITKADIIVDSSKMPIRGEILSHSENFDFYFVHLIRDGRKVAESLKVELQANLENGVQKTIKARSIFKIALFWHIMNKTAERVLKNNPKKCITIRYEDLLNDPETELLKIESLLKVDLKRIIQIAKNREKIFSYYTVAGSRLRMRSDIRMNSPKPNNSFNLSRFELFIFRILNKKLLKKYNYIIK